MIFRQLFDRQTCTYTYLLGDAATGDAVLIDPVREHVDRDLQIIEELGLTLKYTLDTHVHADHVTGAGLLRERVGAQTVISRAGNAPCASTSVAHGDRIEFGGETLEVRATPGHTASCVSYYSAANGIIFTGDALLVRGCGRTDFQQGDSGQLYQSIHTQVFTLPDETRIYPGHDYKGRTMTTVAEEKAHNPRLGGGRTVEEFGQIMDDLGLAPPAHIAEALPANQNCGLPGRSQVKRDPAFVDVARSADGVPEANVDWLAAHLDDVRLIDVRTRDEAAGNGIIGGAEVLPLHSLRAGVLDWDRHAPLALICRSGMRSAAAVGVLETELHFSNVVSIAGGMLDWSASGRPVVSPVAAPATPAQPASSEGDGCG